MKRFYGLLLVFLISASFVAAQGVPMGMQYQAVARDLNAQVMAGMAVEIQVNLLANGQSDRAVYSERHSAETNQLGLFSLAIGQGEAIKGNFAEVPWGSEEVWIEIKIRERGGEYVTVSNSKMLSVPYAFYAATAGDITRPDKLSPKALEGIPSQTWSLFGNRSSNPDKDKLGTTDCADLVIVTNDIERMRILCSGEVLIDSDLDVGNDLTVQNNAEFNITGGETVVHGNLSVVDGSTTNLSGPLNVDGPTDLNNSLNVDGETNLNNTVNVTGGSTTNLTGPLNVDGPSKLNNTLEVDGVTNLNTTLNVNNASTTNLTGALNVAGVTNLGSTFYVNNNSTSILTGPLTVAGPSMIDNTLNVAGCLSSGDLGEARFRFCPEIVSGTENSFSNYPLQVSGAAQGLAIRVNNWAPINNFVAFFADDQMRGRIEGNTGFILQEYKDTSKELLEYDPEQTKQSTVTSGKADTLNFDQSQQVSNDRDNTEVPSAESPVGQQANTREIVDLVLLSVKFIAAVIKVGTSLSSIFDPLDIFEAALNAVLTGADLGVFLGFTITNVGVAYQSGSGDYAEWLLKQDPEEFLQYGEVVGVVGGTISKSFVEADKFMVVSAAPAVVGAMPPTEKLEALYEKIAFIGQVPVKVTGVAEIGDYLLPSGKGDGLAIAVHKEDMLARDYGRIIGVAWQATDPLKRGEAYQMINCAVGINQNDMAGMIEQMQVVMNGMQEAIAAMNPEYEVHAFTTNRTATGPTTADRYSTAPTGSAAMAGYFDDKPYESREELGRLVVAALEEKADVDMSNYPVVERMLLDPEYAASAQAHYSSLLGTYTDWLNELQGE